MTEYELHMSRLKKLETEPGIEIAYEELGEGDKYIFCSKMHHAPNSYEREFAKYGYHVFLLWNRGSGPSAPATEDFGPGWYDVWADDVVHFADKIGVDKFIYTGGSHGAGTGWHILLRHKERVSAFIAVVPGPHNVEEDGSNFRLIIEKNPHINFLTDDNDDPAALKRRRSCREYNKESHEHELKMNYGRPLKALGTEEKLAELLKSFDTPTLIIGGMEDKISTPDLMLRTAKAMPNCKLVIYSKLGHMALCAEINEEVAFEAVHFLNCVEENEGRCYAKVRMSDD